MAGRVILEGQEQQDVKDLLEDLEMMDSLGVLEQLVV